MPKLPADFPGLGYYRHFKGNIYLVVGMIYDSNHHVTRVHYVSVDETDLLHYVRDIDDFNAIIEDKQNRFTYLGSNEANAS